MQRQSEGKRIYLLGYPLGHSISPAMQQAALDSCGLGDWRYELLAMFPGEMPTMLNTLRAHDCLGANITIPYKQAIIPYLDELSDIAATIGAVNTIYKKDDKLIGENTDAPGFMRSLRRLGVEPRGARVALFGAGGAAAAVAFGLAEAGARQISIINRTVTRAERLASHLTHIYPSLDISTDRLEALDQADIIVNATSLGMAPDSDFSPMPAGYEIAPGSTIVDLVYNPPETKLMRQAAEAGARRIGGLEMLVYQGAISFEIWTKREAPLAVMRAAAENALGVHI